MANSYTQLNIHVVFVVKNRENILSEKISNRLFEYLTGILRNLEQFPLAVGGYKNHVHLFFELNPKISLSEVVQKLKSNSSKWINDNKLVLGKFEWQQGYGGFSYAKSQRNTVINYIINQKEHHKQKTFREEYMEMLQKFDIQYNEAYLFDFFE